MKKLTPTAVFRTAAGVSKITTQSGAGYFCWNEFAGEL